MYIEKYWGNYIGDTDDSLTLLDYLAGKQKEEILMSEIISDSGINNLSSLKNPDYPISVSVEGFDAEINYAIDLIIDLAALLLECKVNGSINMSEFCDCMESDSIIRITATPEEHRWINKALTDFTADPLAYDLCEMVPNEDMLEMAEICEELRKELYE